MGTHLEAHRQRYIEGGDGQAFIAGFDAALKQDAFAAHYRWDTFTPEQLLAAMEPPEPEPSNPWQMTTWEKVWDAVTDWLWRILITGLALTLVVLLVVLVVTVLHR